MWKGLFHQAWWFTPVVSATRRLRLGILQCEAS
jgi:hypothetical protein